MKAILLSTVILLLNYCLFSQVTFQKTYDIGFGDFISRVIQCDDNGYLMAGTDMSVPPIDCYLIKTDTAGVVEWSNYYGDGEFLSLLGMYYVNDVKQTSDGGFILTGNCNSSPALSSAYDDLFLIKLDASGNVQWSNGYGGGDTEYGTNVIQTSDGGYLAVGYTYSFGTKDSSNIYMVKTNGSGTMQWDRAYAISPNDDDVANSVEEHSGGYILTGYTTQVFAGVDTTQDIVILGTDLNGNNPFVYTYGTDAESESGNTIERISATELVISGSTSECATGLDDLDTYIMEINTSGTATWCSGYDVGFADEGQYIKQKSGGGYTVIGFTIASLFPLNLKSFLLDVNNSGNVMWARRYGTNMSFNIFSSGQQTHDGGYVIGSMGVLGYDYYLIKTNQNGYSQCNEEDATALKRAFFPAQETPTYTQYSGGSGHSIAVATGSATVTDNTLCVEIPCDTPTVVITPASYTLCEGESVTLTASGADTYSWNTGATTAGISVSPTTTTTYTVTGMTGGICPSYPVNATVTVNPAPSATISGNLSVCDGESTTLTASGGDTYLWNTSSTNSSITVTPGSTTPYTVTVTTTATGCTATATETVTVNSLPNASITGTLNICEGNSTTLTASGGDAYQWDVGQSTAAINVSPSTTTSYTVTVTNTTTGCTATATETVTVTPVPTITISGDTVLCLGESTTLTASGGDSYSWNTGDNTASTTVTPGVTTVYTVTVTIIATGCTNTIPQTVYVNTIPNIIFSGDTVICVGESTTITAAGGDSYSWETGDNTAATTVTPGASTYYTVTVTNGTTACMNVDSVSLTVNALPAVAISGDDTICVGETANIIASGGDGYLWSTTDATASINVNPTVTTTYIVTVSESATGCSDTDSFEVYVNQLPAIVFSGDTSLCIGDSTIITASGGDDYIWSTGSTYDTIIVQPNIDTEYYVTVTDNNTTCMNVDTVNIFVHNLPVATAESDTTVCEGIPVTLTAAGGATYSWSPTTGLSDPLIENPIATPSVTTTYIVTAMNAFGCEDTASVTVTINSAPDVVLSASNVSCFGNSDGVAWVSSVSGYGPFTYLWNTTDTDSLISGLTSGNYLVTVTDFIGCSAVETIIVQDPDVLDDSTVVANVSCFGDNDGMISLNMSGGTAPYTYSWATGHNTGTIIGLNAGAYSVTVTDNNGCIYILNEIDILEPDSIRIAVSSSNASCYSFSDGSVTLSVTGGTPPYSYIWTNGDTLPYIAQVASGLYYYTVTDANNCSETGYETIYEPTVISIIDSLIINPSCMESNDGSICVEVLGGIPPYDYEWSNNETIQCNGGLVSGEYTITVSDFNNCISTNNYLLMGGTESCLLIPTMFSPNGDGFNDKWEIRGIQYYPECEIEIYNRWGDKIFTSKGYTETWDGTHNGRELPMSSFVFIVTLNDDKGTEPIQGIVTIKR